MNPVEIIYNYINTYIIICPFHIFNGVDLGIDAGVCALACACVRWNLHLSVCVTCVLLLLCMRMCETLHTQEILHMFTTALGINATIKAKFLPFGSLKILHEPDDSLIYSLSWISWHPGQLKHTAHKYSLAQADPIACVAAGASPSNAWGQAGPAQGVRPLPQSSLPMTQQEQLCQAAATFSNGW
jgi:hypothetical protein